MRGGVFGGSGSVSDDGKRMGVSEVWTTLERESERCWVLLVVNAWDLFSCVEISGWPNDGR